MNPDLRNVSPKFKSKTAFPHGNWCNMESVQCHKTNLQQSKESGNRILLKSSKKRLEISCLQAHYTHMCNYHFTFLGRIFSQKLRSTPTRVIFWLKIFLGLENGFYLWMELRGQAPSVNPSGTCDRVIVTKMWKPLLHLGSKNVEI